MSEDWLADVKRYVPDPDETAVAGIIRYCGIALQTRDASLVSFGDPEETGRVREHFLKRKLGLTDSDDVLDHEIAAVGHRMNDTTFRNRVTVYYLLAERFGKLGVFHHDSPAAAPLAEAPVVAPVIAEPVVTEPVVAEPAIAPPPPPRAAAVPPPPSPATRTGGKWWLWLLLLLAALLAFLLLRSCATPPAPAPAPPPPASTADSTPAPAPAPANTAAIPDGASVVATTRADKPALNVYFETAKSDVAADFADKAADLKAYATAHPDTRISVSGFNDPTGDAAANAELSKHRAQAVADALKALGIPDSVIDLNKPADSTDAGTSNAAARRVEVSFE